MSEVIGVALFAGLTLVGLRLVVPAGKPTAAGRAVAGIVLVAIGGPVALAALANAADGASCGDGGVYYVVAGVVAFGAYIVIAGWLRFVRHRRMFDAWRGTARTSLKSRRDPD